MHNISPIFLVLLLFSISKASVVQRYDIIGSKVITLSEVPIHMKLSGKKFFNRLLQWKQSKTNKKFTYILEERPQQKLLLNAQELEYLVSLLPADSKNYNVKSFLQYHRQIIEKIRTNDPPDFESIEKLGLTFNNILSIFNLPQVAFQYHIILLTPERNRLVDTLNSAAKIVFSYVDSQKGTRLDSQDMVRFSLSFSAHYMAAKSLFETQLRANEPQFIDYLDNLKKIQSIVSHRSLAKPDPEVDEKFLDAFHEFYPLALLLFQRIESIDPQLLLKNTLEDLKPTPEQQKTQLVKAMTEIKTSKRPFAFHFNIVLFGLCFLILYPLMARTNYQTAILKPFVYLFFVWLWILYTFLSLFRIFLIYATNANLEHYSLELITVDAIFISISLICLIWLLRLSSRIWDARKNGQWP
jgi:hypothetical protein